LPKYEEQCFEITTGFSSWFLKPVKETP